MPYPGWGVKEIGQYRAIKSDIAAKHPKMSDDDVQAFAAKIVNSRKVRVKSKGSGAGGVGNSPMGNGGGMMGGMGGMTG